MRTEQSSFLHPSLPSFPPGPGPGPPPPPADSQPPAPPGPGRQRSARPPAEEPAAAPPAQAALAAPLPGPRRPRAPRSAAGRAQAAPSRHIAHPRCRRRRRTPPAPPASGRCALPSAAGGAPAPVRLPSRGAAMVAVDSGFPRSPRGAVKLARAVGLKGARRARGERGRPEGSAAGRGPLR